MATPNTETVILLNAAVATGSDVELDLTGKDFREVYIGVEGITTATITMQASIDGTNWYGIGVNLWDGSGTYPLIEGDQTLTADGLYKVFSPPKYLRANMTAWTTGTITVTAFLRFN